QDPRCVVIRDAEPHKESVRKSDDLAIAGPRSKRHRVQVGPYDLLASCQRVRTIEVYPCRRSPNLPQLFCNAVGDAAGRMAKFLDLRRKRAAASHLDARRAQSGDAPERRPGEPSPLERGIALRLSAVEKVPVFGEEKTLHKERRNAGEVAIDRLW